MKSVIPATATSQRVQLRFSWEIKRQSSLIKHESGVRQHEGNDTGSAIL